MKPDTPEFILRLDGNPLKGWKEIEVKRSIERASAAFSLKAIDDIKSPWLFGSPKAGAPCTVEIDSQMILDGYIDNGESSYNAKTRQITLSGRDRVGDLIDCAASVDGPFEFNNQKLDKILQKILEPFDIPLTIAVQDVGIPFKRFSIQPGETAFEAIERACRYRAILPISDGIGGLVLTKPGITKAPASLSFGENILSGQAVRDQRDRFSLYVVKGQAEGGDFSSVKETSEPEGRAEDEEISRYRPTVITAEAQGYDLTLEERAKWQVQFNKARSKPVTYNVQGWYAAGQDLWKPNTLVKVKDPILKNDQEFLIISVTYKRSDSTTTTALELIDPLAFDLPAEKQPEKEDAFGGEV